jgi:hypothetical protein
VKRRFLLVLLAAALAVSACGGTGGGGAPSASPEGSAVIVQTSFRNQQAIFALTPVGDGDALLVWPEGAEEMVTLVARRFDAELDAYADDLAVEGPTEQFLFHVSACGRDDGSFSVAWSDVTPFTSMPDGVTLDAANAVAANVSKSGATSGVFRSNPNDLGGQFSAGVVCLGNGNVVAAWTQQCEAIEKDGINAVPFIPAQCADEPADGAYLRVFKYSGDTVAAVRTVDTAAAPAPRVWLAPLPESKFALVRGTLVQVRDAKGNVIRETTVADGPYYEGSLDCPSAAECVAAFANDAIGVHALLFDPRTLAATLDVEVEPSVHESADVLVAPRSATAACDDRGRCLVVWQLQRETTFSDYVETETLGIYGRVISARSGKVGPPELLVESDPQIDTELRLVATETGSFVLAYELGGSIALQRLVID